MNEFFQAMHAREETSSSNQREPCPNGVGESLSGFMQAKTMRLEFPMYDGSEDPTIWICRAEQYFEFQGTMKMRLASYHLEEDAQVWI